MSGVAGYRFHGLAVSSEVGGTADPVEALLGPFRDGAAAAAPELRIALRPAEAGALAVAAPPHAPFRHGDAWVAPGDAPGTLVVASPRAALTVLPGGAELRGAFAPPADADALDALAHVELFLAFALALRPRGLVHLHAATLVAPSGAVIVAAGTGGCGKSTLATALVAAGCAYLGDDVVFAERRAGALRLLGFPRAFHLAEASARAVPATLAGIVPELRTSAGKHRVDAGAAFPGAARAEAGAPAVVLFPEIVDAAATTSEALDRADALGRLLAASLFATTRLGTAAQRALLADAVAGAAPRRVRLGRDLLQDASGTALRLLGSWSGAPGPATATRAR